MKVYQLIKMLKKLPQNAVVAIADHDHDEFEVSGWPHTAELIEKKDFDPDHDPSQAGDLMGDYPNEWVVIRP